jgi:CHASE2 domain-containing sensor protein
MLRLLKKLEEHQPRVIGLDIYRDRPEGEGHADLVKYFQNSDRVIPVCIVPSRKLPEGVAPPPGISAEQVGFGDAVRDPDGIIRRHLWAMEPPAASPCSTYYALSVQLALRYLKQEGISLQFLSKNSWKLGQVVFKKLEPKAGFYHRKLELQGFQTLLNYRANQSPKEIAEQVTLTDILTNRVKPDFVRDKIILIGVTDPTVKDDFNTPYNQEMRGLLIHAQMTSQILSAIKDNRYYLWFLPLVSEVLWVLIWSAAGGILSLQFVSSPLRLGLISGVAIITLNGICLIFLLDKGCVLPLVPSGLSLVTTVGIVIIYEKLRKQTSH